ncbi:uncharacterized protein LOC125179168 [Hyalella azteca]|uniref:Uncharacterized protein LOC125179168 n=1 Tax=Hyalella azteca TaxID=294128 RepID=A0A979FTI6_HYAAZ|nr:uncharacterized protein LOC125179168 [Hyalella azteca]
MAIERSNKRILCYLLAIVVMICVLANIKLIHSWTSFDWSQATSNDEKPFITLLYWCHIVSVLIFLILIVKNIIYIYAIIQNRPRLMILVLVCLVFAMIAESIMALASFIIRPWSSLEWAFVAAAAGQAFLCWLVHDRMKEMMEATAADGRMLLVEEKAPISEENPVTNK